MNNHYLSDLQHQAMELIGPIEFSQDEIDFAQQINDAFPGSNSDYIDHHLEYYVPSVDDLAVFDQHRDKPLVGANFPAMDIGKVMTGSTDVGDLSWVTPVSMLETTCFPTGTPGHTWGEVASGGMSIGHKGMIHAAKIMAIAAMAMYSDPEHIKKVRKEFERSTGGKPYVSPIPMHVDPPQYKPPED
jgi:aminobenzoyl-glutamate utilization protein B